MQSYIKALNLEGVKEREQNVQLLIPSMHVCMYDARVAASVHSRCGLSERRV